MIEAQKLPEGSSLREPPGANKGGHYLPIYVMGGIMNSNITETVVIYDWLSFTTNQHTPEEVIEALGLSHCPWSEISGARGYMDRKYFGCISIHYNGLEDMGVGCWILTRSPKQYFVVEDDPKEL